jgi:hypothetical protein
VRLVQLESWSSRDITPAVTLLQPCCCRPPSCVRSVLLPSRKEVQTHSSQLWHVSTWVGEGGLPVRVGVATYRPCSPARTPRPAGGLPGGCHVGEVGVACCHVVEAREVVAATW